VPRLNDLGRVPDLAMLGLVPLVSIGLFSQLLAATPSPAVHERRVARQRGDVAPLRSLAWGARRALLSPAALPVLALSVLVALGSAWSTELVGAWVTYVQQAKLGAEVSASATPFAKGLTVVFTLYLVMQIAKRGTPSRASWLGVLFLLPSAFTWGALYSLGNPQSGPLPGAVLLTTVDLLSSTVIDGALIYVWVVLAARALKLTVPEFSVNRLLGVVASHGTAWTAILLGSNVVVPGLYYLVQLALVAPVAVLEPDARAFVRSTHLTRGRRDSFFALFVPVLLLNTIIGTGIVVARHGYEIVIQSLSVPQLVPWTTSAIAGTVSNVLWAVAAFALTHAYVTLVTAEREAPVEPLAGGTIAL